MGSGWETEAASSVLPSSVTHLISPTKLDYGLIQKPQETNKRKRSSELAAMPDGEDGNAAKGTAEIQPDTVIVKRRKVHLEPTTPDSITTIVPPVSVLGSSRRSSRKRSTQSTPTNKGFSQNVHISQRRSSLTARTPPRPYNGLTPVMIFSSEAESKIRPVSKATYKSLGGMVTDKFIEANILCVPNGQLKKTYKLIMAVARGTSIVTTDWVEECHRQKSFVAVEEFLPRDGSRERTWNFNLEDAIQRGKNGLTHLLKGTTIFFTTKLKEEMGELHRELANVATALGGEMKRSLPAIEKKGKYQNHNTVVIGTPMDPQSHIISKLGLDLFNKDILTMAVLRGEVERQSDEFLIRLAIKDEED